MAHNISYQKSASIFRNGAVRTKLINLGTRLFRGGIRL